MVREEELLSAYHLTSLHPQRWEDGPSGYGSGDAGASHVSADDWTDPLGLGATLPAACLRDGRSLDEVSLSSKSFDPKAFLQAVHPHASFAELSQGAQQLRSSIEQRSAALKVLVDENFDRFVSVKATTDSVFQQMTDAEEGPLASSSRGAGVQGLRGTITHASTTADNVFRPVLENYVKSMKLRNTIAVLQRSHFFFNLPASLQESIDAGQYEAALRDYQKGRYLLDNRAAQLLPTTSEYASSEAPSAAQTEQQRRIFSRVWDGVEEAMYAMQAKLLAQLREPHHSVEEQEKCIRVLLELDPTTDPVAVFLDAQHDDNNRLFQTSYERGLRAVEAAMAAAPDASELERAKDLYDCLVLVRSAQGTQPPLDKTLGAASWQAVDEFVSGVCQGALHALPTFWRVARDHAEGKFSASGGKAPAPVAQEARVWAAECISWLTSSLSHFFALESFRTRAKQPLYQALPAWVPPTSCSISATQHMGRILATLSDTVKELRALAIPDTSTQLNALLLDTRFHFTEVLCCLWLRDARLCHYLESWTPNTQQPSTTSYLFTFSVFNRWNAREGAFLADISTQARKTTPESQIDGMFVDRLQSTFVRVLEVFLQGIKTAAEASEDVPDLQRMVCLQQGQVLPAPVDRDTRVLLSASNLSHLRLHVIGAWVKQFEDAYHVNLQPQLSALLATCNELDTALLGDSVRRHGDMVRKVISDGILHSGIQWAQLERPTGVNPFVYHALLLLVQVHAQIRATVPALVGRVIGALVEVLAEAVLQSYSAVPTFNLGGMLQATLEIEFVHQTLSYHVSPRAEATLKKVYETISERYASQRRGGSDAMLAQELEGVKQTLIASRKATALEFLCFRRPKSDDARKDAAPKPSSAPPDTVGTSGMPGAM